MQHFRLFQQKHIDRLSGAKMTALALVQVWKIQCKYGNTEQLTDTLSMNDHINLFSLLLSF